MKGAGRCLVTFIPQHAGVYVIDVTFNGHQIYGILLIFSLKTKKAYFIYFNGFLLRFISFKN